jgi:hypothetical protein
LMRWPIVNEREPDSCHVTGKVTNPQLRVVLLGPILTVEKPMKSLAEKIS